MTVRTDVPDNMFAYVVVAARRARQLMAGAAPLVINVRSQKATRIAVEELNKGLLEYQLPDLPGEGDSKDGKRRKG
jgi:DNA-directed RNA polymerase omega subunit